MRGALASLRRAWTRVRHPARSPEQLHRFWRAPAAPGNAPADYLDPATHPRSELLLELLRAHAPPPASVLELGCNAGRNLVFLHGAGYGPLAAVELNADAVALMRERTPAVAEACDVRVGTLEEELPRFPDGAFDVVFSMAVLEHLHPRSEDVLAHAARLVRRVLVTIEDEEHVSFRHFPRDYRRIFEGLGLTQVAALTCDPARHALSAVHVARVFVREPGSPERG